MTVCIRRPSPALIIAILALATAGSGTAVAVTSGNGDSLITVNTLSANRLKTGTVKTVPWSGIVLRGTWTNGSRAPKVARDVDGFLHLRGVAIGDGTTATVGILPASARPTVAIYLGAHGKQGSNVPIMLQPNGSIIVKATLSPNMLVDLDGITYSP